MPRRRPHRRGGLREAPLQRRSAGIGRIDRWAAHSRRRRRRSVSSVPRGTRSPSSSPPRPPVLTVNEVEAMYELYKKLSFSIFKDSLIHKVVSFMLGGVPACAVQDQQRGEHHQGYDLMVAVLFCSA
nr:uncharacterized protein LOC109761320 isoform X4 [Aegilops tauschii subsp. strangulata]